MPKKDTSIALVSPSYISGLLTFGFVLTVVVVGLFPVLRSNGLYNILSSSSSSKVMNGSSKEFVPLIKTFFGSKFVNQILLIAFWSFLGLVTYIISTVIISGLKNTVSTVEGMGYINSERQRLLSTFRDRLAIRMLVIIFWLIYFIIFSQFLVPFCMLSLQAGADLTKFGSWIYIMSSMYILIVTTHVHTVLFRLAALKLRVFGDEQAY